jgi:hypothetical protein
VESCHKCDESTCEDCRVECQIKGHGIIFGHCDSYLCKKCMGFCAGCGAEVCDKHGPQCEDCASTVCKACQPTHREWC